MKSKMSFFDPTLLKKNIGRFAPAWALLLTGLFLTRVMVLVTGMRGWEPLDGYSADRILSFFRVGEVIGLFYAFFGAVLFGGLTFKYLHKTQAAYMVHALPMTRTCLFVTNAVSGLLFFVGPVLVTGLLEQLILVLNGFGDHSIQLWGALGRWLLRYLFFYGLSVFCMHLSGNTIIAVLSYFALNFIGLALPALSLVVVQYYCYGIDLGVGEWLLTLAPMVYMLDLESGWHWILLVYALVGLALLGLSWFLYRKRHVERAGDAMAYVWAQWAFRLIFTLSCALGLGWVLTLLFGTEDALPLWVMVGCFLGWFAASMMVQRTVKVFKRGKNWLGFAVCAVVLAAVLLGLQLDVTGFKTRLPEPEQIASVDIWSYDDSERQLSDRITITDPTDVNAIWEIHTQCIAAETRGTGRLANGVIFDYYYRELHIEYRLKDGSTLRRVYPVYYSDLEESHYRSLQNIYAKPEYALPWYEKILPERIRTATLYADSYPVEYVDEDGTINRRTQEDWYGETTITDGEALRAALLADAAAGRLPIQTEYARFDWQQVNYVLLIQGPNNYSRSLTIPATATATLALFFNS